MIFLRNDKKDQFCHSDNGGITQNNHKKLYKEYQYIYDQ